MKPKNKIVHFWIRILVRFIDFFLCFICSTIVLPLIFVRKNNTWFFQNVYWFYFWVLWTIFLFIFFLVLLPILWQGKTLGSFLFRTKIISFQKPLWKGIVKREIVGAWGVVFIMLIFTIILNHTMILKMVNANQNPKLTAFENFRLSLASTLSGFIIFGQMICTISPLVRKDKVALNDLYGNTRFVYTNKFIAKKLPKKNIQIIPKLVKDEPIKWIK